VSGICMACGRVILGPRTATSSGFFHAAGCKARLTEGAKPLGSQGCQRVAPAFSANKAPSVSLGRIDLNGDLV
jgi:hypothetical protein